MIKGMLLNKSKFMTASKILKAIAFKIVFCALAIFVHNTIFINILGLVDNLYILQLF